MLRLEYMYTCLVMRQELNMWNLIKDLFKKKQVKEPFYHPYPVDELHSIQEYKNEQHKKAMKAEIKKDPSDAIRKAGW